MDKTPEEIAEIQNLPLAELADRLEGLTLTDLAALRALETAEGPGRKGALDAIGDAEAWLEKLASQGVNPPPPAPPEAEPANIQAESTLAPWQLPDYTGPLDIEQASWRNANLKPVAAATKPVKAPKTK